MPLIPGLPRAQRPESALPKYVVFRLDGEDAVVQCPNGYNRCGNQFIVNYPAWTKQSQFVGRNCPYCFKVSQVPPPEILDVNGDPI